MDNYKIYAVPFKIVQWCMSINFNKTGKNIRDTTPLDSWQMLGDKASMSLFVSWYNNLLLCKQGLRTA